MKYCALFHFSVRVNAILHQTQMGRAVARWTSMGKDFLLQSQISIEQPISNMFLTLTWFYEVCYGGDSPYNAVESWCSSGVQKHLTLRKQ